MTTDNSPPVARRRSAVDDDGDDLVERSEDDDLDLLTCSEAGARLTQEIAKQRRLVATLAQSTESSAAELGSRNAASRRLTALIEAQQRNSKPTLDQLYASGFFGLRSTPGPDVSGHDAGG